MRNVGANPTPKPMSGCRWTYAKEPSNFQASRASEEGRRLQNGYCLVQLQGDAPFQNLKSREMFYRMNYSIRITNIQGRINLVKTVRMLNPGMSLVTAKNHVWGKDLVNLSTIRREFNPELYEPGNDYVFTEDERAFV